MLAICDRFKCLPSQAQQEDTTILRLLRVEQLGVKREEAVPDELS